LDQHPLQKPKLKYCPSDAKFLKKIELLTSEIYTVNRNLSALQIDRPTGIYNSLAAHSTRSCHNEHALPLFKNRYIEALLRSLKLKRKASSNDK
jgi:hypothetical protein